jgi:hypothetical protein
MGGSASTQGRLITMIILVIGGLLLLVGVGQRLIDAYERFKSADYITAVSLVMAGVPDNALPVTLLDVDDKTRADWGNQRTTPHAALARLIEESAKQGASMVVSDFDLSPDRADAPGDVAFNGLLSNYKPEWPMLLLARKISFTRGAGEEEFVARDAATTPYDRAVEGKANIRWITTLNDIGGDRQVRRVRMWQTVCIDAGGTAFPSAMLMAAALLYPDDKRETALEAFLKSRADTDCRKAPEAKLDWPKFVDRGVTVPYMVADRADTRSLFRIEKDSRETVVLRRISAGQIVTFDGTGAELAGEIDADPFRNRVVMIGASHADTSDFYNTPLGTMPGVLIIANSIIQAKNITDTEPMNWWLSNIFALGLFLIYAVIVRNLQSALALAAIGVVSLVALFIISRLFSFYDGVNVVAVAVPGFALFKLIDSLAQIAVDLPRRGWRSIFN